MVTPDNEGVVRLVNINGLLTREQAANYLQVPGKTLARWATERVGPRYLKVGKHARYRLADLDAWLDENYADEEDAA
ncbi:helix-turn-helix domain-containing protein [Nocardia uniformis]|uniref:Helix-turn-helix domain-containing protein n=1 Tax=Nocardia uniformis TaxID=53432 RepID=A0A849CC93_9NOCA|nr:helix-turn-helix domain-containing protein [Nocardia uniformis]NNH73647.1 helix-turn-helix domain-containing protein [Nocardia uniformis]